jgi:endogenous inhibitor of DNA gyrase (YacG/DUF329 family)
MTDPVSRPRVKSCPICGKPAVEKARPFCSRRCADIDLHHWFSGAYAVPAVEDENSAELPDERRPLDE